MTPLSANACGGEGSVSYSSSLIVYIMPGSICSDDEDADDEDEDFEHVGGDEVADGDLGDEDDDDDGDDDDDEGGTILFSKLLNSNVTRALRFFNVLSFLLLLLLTRL